MENQLQKVNQSLELSDKELSLAVEIFHVNQVMPYPLSDLQISDWAKSINELMPEVSSADIKKIIDDFKLDNIEWDNKKGIQNIFNAISPKSIYVPEELN